MIIIALADSDFARFFAGGNLKMIRDDVKPPARHLESRVGINFHK
jgi:hypothetical protein